MKKLRTILVASLAVMPSALPALDANGNGISDVWEYLYPAAAANLANDDDGDGCTNGEEGRSWTNPGASASFFKPTAFSAGGGTDQFDFQGQRWLRGKGWKRGSGGNGAVLRRISG